MNPAFDLNLIELFQGADTDDSESQYRLGLCYFRGLGVVYSEDEAFRLFKLAAELGHAKAQEFIGFCYASGIGTEVDTTTAHRWFAESKTLGRYGYSLATEYLLWLSIQGIPPSHRRVVRVVSQRRRNRRRQRPNSNPKLPPWRRPQRKELPVPEEYSNLIDDGG